MVLNEIARRIDAADGGSASGASGRLATACPGSCQRPHPGAGRRASAAASPRPWPRCWAFFLGTLGVHRFYLGSRGFGLVLIGATMLGAATPFPLGLLLSLAYFLRLLLMKRPSFDASFNYTRVTPFMF